MCIEVGPVLVVEGQRLFLVARLVWFRVISSTDIKREQICQFPVSRGVESGLRKPSVRQQYKEEDRKTKRQNKTYQKWVPKQILWKRPSILFMFLFCTAYFAWLGQEICSSKTRPQLELQTSLNTRRPTCFLSVLWSAPIIFIPPNVRAKKTYLAFIFPDQSFTFILICCCCCCC